MKEFQLTYRSSCEGKEIKSKIFAPEDKEPYAIVQILHGLAEHIGRYLPFVSFLVKNGCAVCLGDHLGHGEAVPEEERGYFADRNGWEYVCRDAVILARTAKERYPSIPYFLLGHSMGSFMARTIYLKGMEAMDGLILSGTGNLSSFIVGAGKLVAKLERKRLGGGQKVSALVTSLALGAYDKPFKEEGKNAWISSLSEEVERYNGDPLCGFPVKVGMFLDMFGGIGYIVKKKNIKKADPSVPVLLVSGDKDPVGNMGKGVKAAYKAFCKAGVQDVSMLLYEGCRHEILNDSCREKAMNDILSWIREHG